MATINDVNRVKAANQTYLMSLPYVAGVASSEIDGEPVLLVMLKRTPTSSEYLPTYLDGVRVVTRIVGNIRAA